MNKIYYLKLFNYSNKWAPLWTLTRIPPSSIPSGRVGGQEDPFSRILTDTNKIRILHHGWAGYWILLIYIALLTD